MPKKQRNPISSSAVDAAEKKEKKLRRMLGNTAIDTGRNATRGTFWTDDGETARKRKARESITRGRIDEVIQNVKLRVRKAGKKPEYLTTAEMAKLEEEEGMPKEARVGWAGVGRERYDSEWKVK